MHYKNCFTSSTTYLIVNWKSITTKRDLSASSPTSQCHKVLETTHKTTVFEEIFEKKKKKRKKNKRVPSLFVDIVLIFCLY